MLVVSDTYVILNCCYQFKALLFWNFLYPVYEKRLELKLSFVMHLIDSTPKTEYSHCFRFLSVRPV